MCRRPDGGGGGNSKSHVTVLSRAPTRGPCPLVPALRSGHPLKEKRPFQNPCSNPTHVMSAFCVTNSSKCLAKYGYWRCAQSAANFSLPLPDSTYYIHCFALTPWVPGSHHLFLFPSLTGKIQGIYCLCKERICGRNSITINECRVFREFHFSVAI